MWRSFVRYLCYWFGKVSLKDVYLEIRVFDGIFVYEVEELFDFKIKFWFLDFFC